MIAKQLPMRMLGRLLGVPDDDGDWLVERGDALLGNFDPEFTDHPVGLSDTDEFSRCRSVHRRRSICTATPNDRPEQRARSDPTDDVISDLLAPTIDGDRLTEREFKNFFVLLVSAGNDTTRYTMAAGMKALIEHPDQLAELRDAVDRRAQRRGRVGGRGDPALGHGHDALPAHRHRRRRRSATGRSSAATRW